MAARKPGLAPVDLVSARLLDFFGLRTPWHRRLWTIGTCLALDETIEYADACFHGSVPNTEGLRFVVGSARREVRRDPGAAPLAVELDARLEQLDVKNTKSGVPLQARDELAELTRRLRSDYLRNWAAASPDMPIEFTARALAAHLLDSNFSPDHLHRWTTAFEPTWSDMPSLLSAMADMVEAMPRQPYEVFVPCSAPFDKPGDEQSSVRWLDGAAASSWLRRQPSTDPDAADPRPRRQAGGFLITVEERDPWAAVENARSTIARAGARARVASPSNRTIKLLGWARIDGDAREFTIRRRPRQVEIGSLRRQEAVYLFDDGLPAETDDALELASYMESPSDGVAVTGGWAAIEALLIRPGEGQHYLAADRLAALIACSLPRAELTPLAYQHLQNADDQLAAELRDTTTNFEKVDLVERHLRTGGRLEIVVASDVAAQERIVRIIADPSAELGRVRTYVTECLRRLYNQRNTIAHAGSFRSMVLPATTRTALGLAGAGLDRIVHAQLDARGALSPLSLVARAETELDLVGTPGGRRLSSLLE